MNRRAFLSLFGLGAAGLVLDPERLLWVPGQKTIFIPPLTRYYKVRYVSTGEMVASAWERVVLKSKPFELTIYDTFWLDPNEDRKLGVLTGVNA